MQLVVATKARVFLRLSLLIKVRAAEASHRFLDEVVRAPVFAQSISNFPDVFKLSYIMVTRLWFLQVPVEKMGLRGQKADRLLSHSSRGLGPMHRSFFAYAILLAIGRGVDHEFSPCRASAKGLLELLFLSPPVTVTPMSSGLRLGFLLVSLVVGEVLCNQVGAIVCKRCGLVT